MFPRENRCAFIGVGSAPLPSKGCEAIHDQLWRLCQRALHAYGCMMGEGGALCNPQCMRAGIRFGEYRGVSTGMVLLFTYKNALRRYRPEGGRRYFPDSQNTTFDLWAEAVYHTIHGGVVYALHFEHLRTAFRGSKVLKPRHAGPLG